MSSLRNAVKSHVRTYKERSQLSRRKHLGILEKHKDYVLRAKDYHRKQDHLKRLKRKAKERNPDEFYFSMLSQKTQEGIHVVQNTKKYTHEELQLMKTQDMNYINMKKSVEDKKIEKLKANLHFPETENENRQHLIFVDSEEEAKSIDSKRKDRSNNTISKTNKTLDKEVEKSRERAYEELKQREARREKLENTRQHLEMKKHLMGKGKVNKYKGKELEDGTFTKARFRWRQERKR